MTRRAPSATLFLYGSSIRIGKNDRQVGKPKWDCGLSFVPIGPLFLTAHGDACRYRPVGLGTGSVLAGGVGRPASRGRKLPIAHTAQDEKGRDVGRGLSPLLLFPLFMTGGLRPSGDAGIPLVIT